MAEDQDLAKTTLDCFHALVYLSFLIKDNGLRDRLMTKAKPLLDHPACSNLEQAKRLKQTAVQLLDYLELLTYLKSAPLGDLLETQKQLLELNLVLFGVKKNYPKRKAKITIKPIVNDDSILDEKILELIKTKENCGLKDITNELGREYSSRTIIRYINKLLVRGAIQKTPGLDNRFPSYTVTA